MKRIQVIVTIALTLGVLFTGGNSDKTPGAKATEMAAERAVEGKGHGGKKAVYIGTVDSVDGSSLTLKLASGKSLTFAVTDGTKITAPKFGGSATLNDVKTGMKALVLATSGEGNTLLALQIHITPGKPNKIQRVGTVTAYTPGASITLRDKDNNTYTFAITSDTRILPRERAGQLAVGSRVTIISPRDVSGGALTAQGIVIHGTGNENGTPEPTERPEATE
ncbi:MAG: hypothetical protein HY260_01865 [Chloroflexi bacterium]|nr:hypothetical protein [Chloroflexota bacterium]